MESEKIIWSNETLHNYEMSTLFLIKSILKFMVNTNDGELIRRYFFATKFFSQLEIETGFKTEALRFENG